MEPGLAPFFGKGFAPGNGFLAAIGVFSLC